MSTTIENDVTPATDAYLELEAKITKKTARFGVIGLGYVGLPLGLTLSDAGFNVTGIDIDTNRIDSIVAGRSYITDIGDQELRKAMSEKRFRATTDLSEIRNLDAVSICVPDATTKDERSGHVVRHLCRRCDCERTAPRTTRHPGKHNLSGNDRRTHSDCS